VNRFFVTVNMLPYRKKISHRFFLRVGGDRGIMSFSPALFAARNALRLQRYSLEEAEQEIKANLGIDQLQNQLTCVQNRQDDHAREFQNFRTQCTAKIASKADMEYVDDLRKQIATTFCEAGRAIHDVKDRIDKFCALKLDPTVLELQSNVSGLQMHSAYNYSLWSQATQSCGDRFAQINDIVVEVRRLGRLPSQWQQRG